MSAVANVTSPDRSGRGDRIFEAIVWVCAALNILLIIGIVLELTIYSWPSIQQFGLQFLTTSTWNPNPTSAHPAQFGALAFMFGTIVTSLIGLLLATPLAVGAAIFINEYCPPRLGDYIAFFIELLVAIPSVAFGVWGLFVLVPVMRYTVDPILKNTLGKIPIIGDLFSGPDFGTSLLTAGVILAIMILPTILAISREVVRQVPRLQKEGMIALGATKWEAVRVAVLPYARVGIIGAALLGLARALGETMAVTMVVGNSSTQLGASLFRPGYTLASAIANQFTEASSPIYFSAVVELGLALLLVSAIANVISRWMVKRAAGASFGLLT